MNGRDNVLEIRCPACHRLQGTAPKEQIYRMPIGFTLTETRTCSGAMKSRCDQELLVTYSSDGIKVESRTLKPRTQAQAQALNRTRPQVAVNKSH